MSDAAHLLFPSDAPKPATQAAQSEPVLRSPTLTPGWSAPRHQPSAGSRDVTPDPSAVLFKNENATEQKSNDLGQPPEAFREFDTGFDSAVLEAVTDGDTGRADEIKAARATLIQDAITHGSDAKAFGEALQEIKSIRSNYYLTPTAEQLEASHEIGIEAIQREFPDTWESDLKAAHAFIVDLDKKVPGVIATLERHGAGNNPSIIKKAIREARKRGF